MNYRREVKLAHGANVSRFKSGPLGLFEDVVLEPRILGGRVFVFGRRKARRRFRALEAVSRRIEEVTAR